MVVSSLLAGHEHHAYGHGHHSTHEAHPLDDILGCSHEPRVHYIWVGECKGRYRQRGHGHFDYVGPHKGDYEKEVLPADHTMRYLGVCCCLLILALVSVIAIKALLEDPPFDCQVALNNWQMDWSMMKKEWCCENKNLGCPIDPSLPETSTVAPEYATTAPPPAPEQPHWLRMWLADMNIGAKFIMTMVLALLMGCSCGGFFLYIAVRYWIPPKKSKTELELMAEVNKLLDRANLNTKGELTVTLSWDATEDLDLHLRCPPNGAEISWERTEHLGGQLSIDVNTGQSLAKKTRTPIEHIYWGPYNWDVKELNPPKGEYEIWVKMKDGQVIHCDANLTIVKTIRGQREIYHHRMVPGCFEKKICSFSYEPPMGAKP